jgi:hypothetical protein
MRFITRDGEQRQTEITDFSEQAMQGSLIDHWALKQCLAVVLQRDGHAVKPRRPLLTQVTLEPDPIDHGLIWISVWIALVRHHLVPIVSAFRRLCRYCLFDAQVA